MSTATDPVTAIAVRALDAASMNHAVIANNIANANTPGFVRQRLDFSAHFGALRAAADSGAPLAAIREAPAPRLVAEGAAVGQGNRADLDAAELAQNTLQYQALIKALGKHMALLRAAVNEGKR